jgi:hypothetical protein
VHSSSVWRLENGAWVDLGGTTSKISAKNSTTVFAVSDVDDYVWWNDGSWNQLDATVVEDVSVETGGFITSVQGGVAYYWNGSNWIGFGGSGILGIAAAVFSWCYNSSGIYRWNNPGWVSATGTATFVDDLSMRITPGSSSAEYDRYLLLCENMLRDDLFEIDWRGNVTHRYEADFSKSLANISIDLRERTSGGSIAGEVLTLQNGDYLMIPFWGPLPISGDPGSAYLELEVSAITGDGATCQIAQEPDLADMEEVIHDDLVIGMNTIYIPDLAGLGYVAIGLKAAASGSVSLSGLRGAVKRYVAPRLVPTAEQAEEFKIRIESTAGPQLATLCAEYNDRYFY